jgi:thiol-disulfide isomerase/thioredoxin
MGSAASRWGPAFAAALMLVVSALAGYAQGAGMAGKPANAARLPIEGDVPSLSGVTTWLNSRRLSASNLRGKVVLVDFWSYSCINWRRSLPYVRAWAQRYGHQGLVVIGVHAPEFQFETQIENVRRAAREMNITYPIAIDNQYWLWNGFENDYLPALYLIDAQGRIRYYHVGEGDYSQAERNIQRLLREAGARGVTPQLVPVQGAGAEAPPDLENLRSPENYLGYRRSERFESQPGVLPNQAREYASPQQLPVNHWALAGTWVVGAESVVLSSTPGRISYVFHARDLHLIMGPGERHAPIRYRVTIDGHAPGEAHGLDVDAQGNGTILEPRLYQLIRQPAPILDHRFEIQFLEEGAEVFSITFG